MKVAILGAGSMGTAMVALLSEKEIEISLWARRFEVCKDIMENHVNSEYLPHVKLKSSIKCETNLTDVLTGADLLVFTVPSHAITKVLQQIKSTIALTSTNSDFISLSVVKGIIHSSGRIFASEEIEHFLDNDVAVFAGPTFASEVAKKIPTVTTLASKSANAIDVLKPLLETDYLKVFVTDDVRGVQLCSVLKNIYSIAIGMIDGMGSGDNVRGLFVHYAVEEMRRILTVCGGKAGTIFSPAGIGDFVATAFSEKSRNRSIGSLLGLGIIKNKNYNVGILAEGLKSISTIKKLSDANEISTPIINFVHGVCFRGMLPVQAFRSLENEVFGR